MPHCRFVLARNTTPQLCDKNTLRLTCTSRSTTLMPSAQKTGNLFLISCFGAPFYVAAVIQFSFDYNSINEKLLCYDGLSFLSKQWCQSSCTSFYRYFIINQSARESIPKIKKISYITITLSTAFFLKSNPTFQSYCHILITKTQTIIC